MIYIIWPILLILFVSHFLFQTPIWISIVGYLIVMFVKVKEKIGNNKDWLEISKRNEKIKLEKVAEEMAQKGLAHSSIRINTEKKIIEDFQYE